MKARFFNNVSLGLALSAMPFVGACSPQATNPSPSLVTTAQAEPSAVVATNPVAATNSATEPLAAAPVEFEPPPPETAPLPAPAPGAGKTLPPNISPTSPVGEVAKLAQAGVDESVMLAFVNNASSAFNLTSDEIVYLNDIGVPDSVVTAMMQRDQGLKQSAAAPAAPQTAATPPAPAAAPAYVNSPQPETQPVEAAPTQPVSVTYNYFYDSLSPYGTWIDIDGYGPCWQPTVVVINRGWRPYFDRGRWLYTDAGWYWHSDYSWGWATFHYGRWFSHPRWGWCWYPGYVWGPAWVTWRYSGDYCGWAPLPPAAYYQPGIGFYYHGHSVGVGFSFGLGITHYTFVPWGRFCDRRPWHHRASASRVTQIYNNTTIINNVVTGDRNRIINHGVPIEHVRRHSGSEIRQVAIRETSEVPRHAARGERLERDGRTLVVHRPNLSAPTSPAEASRLSMRDASAAPQPVRGAGAAAQLESSRPQGRERAVVETRDGSARRPTATPSPTASPRPTEGRSPAPSAPAISASPRTAPPQLNPTPAGDRATPRGRDDRPDNSNRDRNRQNNRSAIASPLVVHGGTAASSSPAASAAPAGATVNPPAAPKPPAGSLVVIGRQDSNSDRNRNADQERRSPPARTELVARSTSVWSPPQPSAASPPSAAAPPVEAPRISAPTPAPSISYNRPATPAPRIERQEAARSPSVPTYSAPSPSAPRASAGPSYTPAPSRAPAYSAPRSTPVPSQSAPSYSAPPRSSPAPSFSPAPSRSSSAPAHRQDRSDSGRHGSSRRN